MKAIVCTKYGSPEVHQLREVGKPTPQKNDFCSIFLDRTGSMPRPDNGTVEYG